jgi:hypothetical protein
MPRGKTFKSGPAFEMNFSNGSEPAKDFYEGLMSNHWPKIVCMALSCTAMLAAVVLLLFRHLVRKVWIRCQEDHCQQDLLIHLEPIG